MVGFLGLGNLSPEDPDPPRALSCFYMCVCHSWNACGVQDSQRLTSWPPAVESSIAVEDAVENRGLYRVFVLHLF